MRTGPAPAPTIAKPRVRSVPDYEHTTGDETIELCEAAGVHLDLWQQEAVRDILAENADGNWLAFEQAIIATRQNGKGEILLAILLADLFLLEDGRLILFSAQELKTAKEMFERLIGVIEANDWMKKQVAKNGITTANGNVGIRMKNGVRILFIARSKGSGRGFSADRFIADEAYDLPDEFLAAVMPTLSARPNPSIIYASSAPLDRLESNVLRRIMRRGRRTPAKGSKELAPMDQGLVYIEFSADPKAGLDDVKAWLDANPAVSSGRMTLDFIRTERASMTDAVFARERLGIVDESGSGGLIPIELWDDLGDSASSPLDPIYVAVDVAPDQSWSTITMAGERADGLIHIEVIKRGRGIGWVADTLADLTAKWDVAALVLDPIGQAAALTPALDALGVDYNLYTTRDVTASAAYFYSLITEKRLRHFPQEAMRFAVEAATKRKVGESGWAFNKKNDTDITALVAASFAAYAFARSRGMADPEPKHDGFIYLS